MNKDAGNKVTRAEKVICKKEGGNQGQEHAVKQGVKKDSWKKYLDI